MALFFLQSTNVARFKFRKDGEEVIDGHRVWKVRYQEARKPTIIRTSSGKDMPLTGTYWIDATAGEVLRTHMEIATEATMSADQKARTGPTAPAGGPANTLGKTYGSIPLDTDTGVVRRLNSSASVTVSYKKDSRLGLLVPDTMMETYEGPTVNAFTGREEVNRSTARPRYSGSPLRNLWPHRCTEMMARATPRHGRRIRRPVFVRKSGGEGHAPKGVF